MAIESPAPGCDVEEVNGYCPVNSMFLVPPHEDAMAQQLDANALGPPPASRPDFPEYLRSALG